MDEMHKKRTYSLKKRSIWYWIRILAVFGVLVFCLIIYISSQIKRDTYDGFHQTMDLYVEHLADTVELTESFMWEMANNNSDTLDMQLSDSRISSAVSQLRTAELLENALNYVNDVEGLFVFGRHTSAYVCRYKKSASNMVAAHIKDYMRACMENGTEPATGNWQYLAYSGHEYLIKISRGIYGYYGAWICLDYLNKPFEDNEAVLLYADEDGVPYDDDWSGTALSTDFFGEELHSIRSGDGTQYMQIGRMLSFADCSLNALIPSAEVNAPMYRMLAILVVAVVIIFLVSLFWTISYNQLITKPLDLIRRMISQQTETDKTQLPRPDLSDERCEEVLELGALLDTLMAQIESSKLQVYEDELNMKALENQYLKSQAAPHFLVNCLSAIESMAVTGVDKAVISQFVRTLSDHLRYALRDQSSVSLREEIRHVENYLEMTSLRFPGFLKWEIDVEEACMEASVFPLVLLMFTENAIKYNMVMGEDFFVKIVGRMSERGGEKFVTLVHLDSGSGYSEKDLEYINRPIEAQMHDIKGHKIGSYNLIKRLGLIYGDKAYAHFSNEPGSGARSEISVPYVPYTQEAAPDKSWKGCRDIL